MTDKKFSHTDDQGKAQMVDVSQKPITERIAVATATITMQPATIKMIKNNELQKGDVLAVAKLAGIQAGKKTAELIPLCHPLSLTHLDVIFELTDSSVIITATAKTTAQTGVEMEALTTASTSALTIYDMIKAVDRGAVIGDICLLEKSGGKSERFAR